MATTIKLKNGSGAPLAGDLVQGEPALDLTNKRLYTEDSGGTVIEVGTNPSTLTVDTDTLVVDATNNRVGVGTASPGRTLDVDGVIRSNGTSSAFALGGNSSTPTEGAAIHRPANGTIAFVNESSESMRIDSSGNVGIGTTSPQQMLHLSGSVPEIRYTDTTGNEYRAGNNNGKFRIYDQTAASDRLVIDGSGNVGVGTTSPNYPLHLNKSDSAGCWAQFTNSTTGTGSGAGALVGIDSNEDFRILQYEAKALTLYTSATERMRIDSSGNVGIGTTSPNSNIADGIDCNSTLYGRYDFTSGVPSTGLGMVCTADGNVSGFSSGDLVLQCRPGVNSRSIRFFTGNTSTERMQIDASGNVGIGTTSPDSILHLSGGAASKIIIEDSASPRGNYIGINSSDNLVIAADEDNLGSSSNIQFRVDATERMRIDSSGFVGIGTSSPNAELHIINSTPKILLQSNGAGTDNTLSFLSRNISNVAAYADIIGLGAGHNSTNAPIVFTQGSGQTERMRISENGHVIIKPSGKLYLESSSGFSPYLLEASNALTVNTNGSERMRIDSSGNLLVFRTTPGTNAAKIDVQSASDQPFLEGYMPTTGVTRAAFVVRSNVGSTNSAHLVVRADGDVENTNNNYGSLSDERLKSNIVDASSQIDDIMAVQVRSYTLNETGATHIGVVAQELEASGMSGLVKTDDEGMKSVKYSILYMKAIKALQEAVTRIETLEAEVAALKGA